MDEDREVHPWRPPHAVERCTRARKDTRKHVDEGRTIDRRPPVEGDGAPALQQECTGLDWTLASDLLIVSGRPTCQDIRSPRVLTGPSDLADKRPFDVILIDCDGRVASDLVHYAAKSGTAQTKGLLADQLRRTDALVLAVDASAEPSQVDADFVEFADFLKLYRRERGRHTEVAALPVLLAIAKCDLLAKPGDTASVWAERIEAKKDEVADRFHELLDRADASLFGSLAFEATATAIKQPVLANAPARPEEPLGVAELFRAALDAARDFHKRVERARLSLNRTLAGLVGMAAVLAAFAVVIGLARGLWTPSPLSASIDTYRSREGKPPAGYLDEPLDRKINELVVIAKTQGFGELPAEDRDFVSNRLDELPRREIGGVFLQMRLDGS
jgi:hypothetical protein